MANPPIENAIFNSTAMTIMLDSLLVNVPAIEAGRANMLRTRMIPTKWISNTVDKEIKTRRRR